MACSAPTPITSRAMPTTSIGPARPSSRAGLSSETQTVNENSPTGRLIRKIHGQE